MDDDSKTVVLWKILTSEAEMFFKFLLNDEEHLKYLLLKEYATAWLLTATDGRVGMDLNAVERYKKKENWKRGEQVLVRNVMTGCTHLGSTA